MKLLQNTRQYRRTPKGVLTNMYQHLKARHPVDFSLQEFHSRFLGDKKFNRLYREWNKSGFQKEFKPSLDRISHLGNYSVNNTQMLNWKENRFKQSMERRSRKGVVIQLKNGKEVARYRSQREAVRQTGLSQGLISEVLNSKRNHTCGYQFIYENPELLKKIK